ncbi:hypothetical protein [Moorena producens]|uniref:hypothetical protein n=1 Tax=Moorena producens TaxID=1155739 RepID=UPI000A87BC82|nr:hypothetical protein [Moorena producens]
MNTAPSSCSRLDAVAHGGNHGSCSWLEVTVRQLSLVLMQSLMGETPKTAQITLINKFYPFSA